jgi:hypothetical protein
MGVFWSIVIIAVLIGFNFFSFDMMMRMRSDVRAIRKHLLGTKTDSDSSPGKTKDGGATSSDLGAKSIAAAATKTFNKLVTDMRN